MNLLVVLEALLEEAHVTRAAERVGLSQPAVSNVLKRCRELFHDPLLRRTKGGMVLTPKGRCLRAPLRRVLADTLALIEPPRDSLADIRRVIHLAVSGIPTSLFLPSLWKACADKAPGVSLAVQPWQSGVQTFNALSKGEIDLALSVSPAVDESFHQLNFLNEHFVIVMRSEHPVAGNLSLDNWLNYPHVLVSSKGRNRGALDRQLLKYSRRREIGVVVPDFASVFPLLIKTNLIAMVPNRCLPSDHAKHLVSHPPPIHIDGFSLYLIWHARQEDDVALQFIVQQLQSISSSLSND